MATDKRFTIDARAILTWGRESIRDTATAIVELVKNSYDAGAKIVELRIFATGAADGEQFICITDDGEGMNEDDIIKKWLCIGYSSKRTEKVKDGRRRTGEKGIGRISADRLGGTLELRTQKKRFPASGLKVDWSQFEDSGTNVQNVPVDELADLAFMIPVPSEIDKKTEKYKRPPEPRRNSQTCSGTQLTIKDLRDTWKESDVEELRTSLSVLTPPFGDVTDFQIRLETDINPSFNGVIESPFYKTAEIELDCKLDKAGNVTCEFTSRGTSGKKLTPKVSTYKWSEFVHVANLVTETKENSPPPKLQLGATRVQLLFYPRHSETLRGTDYMLSDLRDFLDQNAGVKVYRDNIRVAPYGDPKRAEGDWIGLGDRKARNPAGPARKDYRLSPNQLVGAVYITRDGNEGLADTSAREGLIHSDAFYQLKAFVLQCIVQLEFNYHLQFLARQENETPAQPPREVVGSLREQLRSIVQSLDSVKKESSHRKIDIAMEMIATTTAELKATEQSLEELANEATIYRTLATLGIAASTFGHETLGSIEGAEFSINEAMAEIRNGKPDVESILEELEKSLNFTARITAWGKFALGRIKRDKRRRLSVDIKKLVGSLVDEVRTPFEGSSTVIDCSLRNCEGRVFPMDVEAVVLNLLTNAYFFAKQVSRDRKIRVEVKPQMHEDKKGFLLTVADSGPGVPKDRRSQIWQALYSTKADDKGRVQGTGLGLTIVDNIVKDAGGWRSVDKDDTLSGAHFEIWLPFG
jgi:signal transduction histidine kinase